MRIVALICATLLPLVARSGELDLIAGTGKAGFSGDGGPATQAELNNPYGLTIGPDGSLYVCDMGNHRVRKIDSHGIVTTVAGNGEKGWSGDGGPAREARLNEPYEVRFDRAGNMFFVEMRNNIVRRVDAKTAMISTIAGTGSPGFSGDGGPATKAALNQPHSIQFVGEQLWICDIGNHRIRSVDLKTGVLTTVGGTGEKLPTKDGAPLLGNPLNGPRAIDVAPDGTIWLALREGNAIYRIDPKTRIIARAAGTGVQGFTGNGGPALQATLSGPKGISVAPNGDVVFADTESHSIRYINVKKGTVELMVGDGKRGLFSRPHGVFVDAQSNVWIGDSENNRVIRFNLPR